MIKADWRRFGVFTTVVEEYMGKSSDIKPILPPNRNGSIFYEMDTKALYMFDGETQTWILQ